MKKIVFIGNIQWGKLSTGGGVQTKNQHFLRYILNKTEECVFFDTWGKSSILSLLKTCYLILRTNQNIPIILSLSSRGPYIIAMLFSMIGLKRRCFYWVAGGDLAVEIKNKGLNASFYNKFYEKVVVQCEYLKTDLEELGINNCVVVPNFKPIYYKPKDKNESDEHVRFVYLSRIIKEKGVEEIIEAVRHLNNPTVSVDFYGSLCEPYTQDYFAKLKGINIQYKGFLNLKEDVGYEILSQYDALLFPTYFIGEGFPGTLIDAFIAGLPSIVSDFHANSEVIQNNYNGIIIPPKDSTSLCKAINEICTNKQLKKELRNNSLKSAEKYDVKNVLDKAFEQLKISL